eukprot:s653_g19.t1
MPPLVQFVKDSCADFCDFDFCMYGVPWKKTDKTVVQFPGYFSFEYSLRQFNHSVFTVPSATHRSERPWRGWCFPYLAGAAIPLGLGNAVCSSGGQGIQQMRVRVIGAAFDIDEISSKHLRDLRKPRQLPPQVVKLLQAIALLLGHKDVKVSNLKKLLADTLPQKLSAFDPRRITQLQRTKLRALLSGAEVQPDQIATVCLPFTSLAQWCECVMIFLSHTQALQSEKEKERVEKAEEPETKPSRSSRGFSSLQIQPDLSRLSPEQLKEVKDLTITKPNIGSVVFHGTTDCSTLDLQKDIVLKRGYVLVYPDTKRKPPVGEGLNKPATVTMYECFPPGEQIGDKEAKDYKEKIKRMTEENGACKFIDYDCQTGVWKFDVARF